MARTITDLVQESGVTMAVISKRFGIPYRTMQDWCAGRRTPPDYVVNMMAELLRRDDADA